MKRYEPGFFDLSQAVDEKQAICRCDALSEVVKQVEKPSDFVLSFSDKGAGVFCTLPEGVTLLSENGWFLSGNDIWYMEIGSVVSQSMRGSVTGEQLIDLLTKDLPSLINRSIEVDCPYSYDDTPYLWITVKDETESTVSLQREIQVGELRPVSGTHDYVWDKNTLRPKQYDELMERFFAKGNNIVLTGDEIPEIALAARGAWEGFLRGEVQRLLELHPVYENAELLLCGYSEQHNGIGKACARADVVPLSTHSHLRDFLAQVIRHTENKLRETKSYQGKLRGIELDEELGRLIDEYLERELIKKPEKIQSSITIDVNKLARATAEAEYDEFVPPELLRKAFVSDGLELGM